MGTLSELRCYVALAVYPLIIIFIFDWGSVGARWSREHRSRLVPQNIRSIDEARGRFLLLLKYALLSLVLIGLTRGNGWFFAILLSHFRPWLLVFNSGILGGVLLFVFRRGLSLLSRSIAASESNDFALRGPTALWLTIFLAGALSEELWRALCITGLEHNGYSLFAADILPALFFSLAHMSGLPPRMPAGLAIAGVEVIVGLTLGAIYIWSGSVVSSILASLIFYTVSFLWLRKQQVRLGPAANGEIG
jgi:membrane protease YdiL (CAAX protease family)